MKQFHRRHIGLFIFLSLILQSVTPLVAAIQSHTLLTQTAIQKNRVSIPQNINVPTIFESMPDDIFRDICQTTTECACLPIPLTQANVTSGLLLIDQTSNYKFCEDITATLLVTATLSTVDMNNHKLAGIAVIVANDVTLKNGYIEPPATLDIVRSCNTLHVPSFPFSAIAIVNCVTNTYIQNITIACTNSTNTDIHGNGINGCAGIYTNGIKTFIEHCNIATGAGAPGADATPSTAAGNGGNGGDGIISENDTTLIIKTLITTGTGGNGGSVGVGDVPAPGGNGGNSGTGIRIYGNTSSIFECEIFSGLGGDGGNSCCSIGGNGGSSGDGIYNNSQTTVIKHVISRTSNGGIGGTGSSGNNGGNGGNSGNAIETQGTQIIDAILSTGNGGDGADGDNGGNGGNAGFGLYVHDACRCETRSIIVEFTGSGGNGGNAISPLPFIGNGGNGGNGADAVHITQGSKNTELRLSTLSNTGAGGLGGTSANGGIPGIPGSPGRAVTDFNTDLCSIDPLCTTTFNHPSIIFENFAYAISDTTIRYLINGKAQESGKASDASCNRLDNVYVDCNVNEVFDICAAINTTQTTLEARCEEIENNFEGVFTLLTNLQNTLTELRSCCPCDFFITQSPNGQPNNHPVTSPITQPGTYCVTEDLVGTLSINTSNVTILFDGYTLFAPSPGIVSNGNNHIKIEGGTITNGTPAIDIQNGFDISILNMTFTDNAVGINLNTIEDFTVYNNIFSNYSDTTINLIQSNNGKITCCKIHDNNTTPLALTLINTVSCSQLTFDRIIMTDTINTQTLIGINAFNMHESTFNNIQITSNHATALFKGMYFENSDDNIISACTINKNTVIATDNAATLIGIHTAASEDGGSKNNRFINCLINGNRSDSANTHVTFVGMHIAGTIGTTTSISDNGGENTLIESCLIQSNTSSNSDNISTVFAGITIGSAIENGSVGNNVGKNSSIRNCSVNDNASRKSDGDNTTSIFIGIGLGSTIEGGSVGDNGCENISMHNCAINNNASFIGSNNNGGALFVGISMSGNVSISGVVGKNGSANASFNNCTVNNNLCSKGLGQSSGALFMGINISGNSGAFGTIGDNSSLNCSINNCTVNGNDNISTATLDSAAFFMGINLGGSIGAPSTFGNNSCTNAAIHNCSINSNTCDGEAGALFIGVNLIGTSGVLSTGINSCSNCSVSHCTINNNSSTGSRNLNFFGVCLSTEIINACNDCQLEAITINQNSITTPDTTAFLTGIQLFGAAGATAGGCNNVNCTQFVVKENTISDQGSFTGFLINGSGAPATTGGCNNLILKGCEVQNNNGTQDSDAYRIIAPANSGTSGARNIQFEDCTAQQNINNNGNALNGFNIADALNLQLTECVSIENTSTGFKLNNIDDSSISTCKAIANGADGFSFAGTSSNITITQNQALGNAADGFDFDATTTLYHIRNNIAQNNQLIGFDNVDGNVFKHQFYGNFAQANSNANYVGVDLVRQPGVHTGPFTNVSDGPQDCDLCDTLTTIAADIRACCACDFFITQSANGQSTNHPITDPITQPGVYCVTEDLVGTLSINASNVTIFFDGHTLYAPSPGIISNGNNHIKIEGGTITNGTPAIDIQNGLDIAILNMTFTGNAIGINFNAIEDFTIHNNIFSNYSDTNINLTQSNNGKITCCKMHNNNTTPTKLTLINTATCNQLTFDEIIMTDNINTQTFIGINAFNTHESFFRNIQITYNDITNEFKGIRLENCDNATVTKCCIKKNSITSNDAVIFIGIEEIASIPDSSKNNIISSCVIQENITLSVQNINVFVGILVGGAISTNSPYDNICENTIIDSCLIQSNTNNSTINGAAFFAGISVASAVGISGSIGNNVGTNSFINNCIISNNMCTSDGGEGSGANLVGINLGGTSGAFCSVGNNTASGSFINNCVINNNSVHNGIGANAGTILTGINLGGNIGFNGSIGDKSCASCSINNCTINNNDAFKDTGDNGAAFLFGINLGGSIGGPATVSTNVCTSCSVDTCAINGNICTSNATSFCVGINLIGSTNGGGTGGTNSCGSCSVRNCTINNNSSDSIGDSHFIGIDLGALEGSSCNDCQLDTITILQNSINTNFSSSSLFGIRMNGEPGTFDGGCNNITCKNCLIEGNNITTAGVFIGIFVDGVSAPGKTSGCNNFNINSCQVNGNTSVNSSDAYQIIGSANGGTGGCRNAQLKNCTAKQNSCSGGTLNGFNVFDITNISLSECVSVANTSIGFKLNNTVDSCIEDCKALDNGANGFSLEGTTNNVTLIDNQSLGNTTNGFEFNPTTTTCLIRSNIAQNNGAIGFNNTDNNVLKHQFYGNFAQTNIGGDYFGVNLVRQPGVHTGPFTNVSDGPQDCDLCDTLTTMAANIQTCCGCDFFITQSPNGQTNNHPITDPITQPGVYCVAEDIIGTLTINASDVTIIFDGHTLNAPSPGIVSSGNNHIKIEGGTITNGTPAIDIQNGIDIAIFDMTFTGNAVGISLNAIKDFTIKNNIFTNYSDTNINLINSNNGTIANCQIHTNNTAATTLTLINTITCNQLMFEDIIMTDNTTTQTLIGINTLDTHDSMFNKIQMTNNSSAHILKGIIIENGNNNILRECSLNKNTISSTSSNLFIGIHITASINEMGNNNKIEQCTLCDNTVLDTTMSQFIGMQIAGAINGSTSAHRCCINNSINIFTINNNKAQDLSGTSTFIGININGALNSTMIGNENCNGCSFNDITINSNSIVSTGSTSALYGIYINGSADLLTNGGCNNILCTDGFIAQNSNNTGSFFGIFVDGSSIQSGGTGGANNLICKTCEVSNNTSAQNSNGYQTLIQEKFIPNGIKNILFDSCIAQQNTSLNSCNGFSLLGAVNAQLNACTSTANTSTGFLFTYVNNSTISNSTANSNGNDGFGFIGIDEGTGTRTINILNNQASGNENCGFSYDNAAFCYTADSIAQNNSIGFNNTFASNVFARNYAQNNSINDFNNVTVAPVSTLSVAGGANDNRIPF